jgi:hypothetical protein
MSEHRVVYSYSHLNRFASCPRSFQLHYIDRLPAEDSDASRFGRLLHRVCERVANANGFPAGKGAWGVRATYKTLGATRRPAQVAD